MEDAGRPAVSADLVAITERAVLRYAPKATAGEPANSLWRWPRVATLLTLPPR
jgi:hypothetical protein